MRNECNIIRDILPLYLDGIVSGDTASFVEEHLENCAACRTALETMKVPTALETAASAPQTNDEAPLKAFAKQWNRKKRITISAFAAVLLLAVLLGSSLISYLKFDTANPFSAASGFLQITAAHKDYVEIQRSPKVVLAQPGDAQLTAYMESRGFAEIEEERLGSLRVFTNGEEKEWVMYSQNGFFAKWTWQ